MEEEGLPVSFRRTALLALLVALVGGFYWWYEVQGSKSRHEAAEERLRVLKIEPQAVSAVALKREGLELRAVRRDGRWVLTKPIETGADQEAVNRLLKEASRAKRISVIEEKPQDLKPYGLDPPRLHIVLSSEEGASAVDIGSRSPTGRGVYAVAGPSGPVVLIERGFERAADKGLFDFRDRKLLDAELKEVAGLRLQMGGETLEASKTDEGGWELQVPIKAPADPEAVKDLLRALTGAEVQAFIDEPSKDAASYGLESPRAALTLLTKDGRSLAPLYIGKNEEAGGKEEGAASGRLYARRGKAGPVLLLEGSLFEGLPTSAEALRARRLFSYELDDVDRIEVASAQETVVLERRGERDWVMEKPLAAPADNSAVRNFLWDLKDLKAKTFLDEADPAQASLGFAPSAKRYILNLKDRDDPLLLELGAATGKRASRYARSSALKGLITVEAKDVEKLKDTSLDLRDRSLLGFETEEVRGLSISLPGREVVAWKDGPIWMLEEPSRGELKAGTVQSLLWTLQRFKFSDVVEEVRVKEPEGAKKLEARIWTESEEPVRLEVVEAKEKTESPLLAFGSSKEGLYTVANDDLIKVFEAVERLLAQNE